MDSTHILSPHTSPKRRRKASDANEKDEQWSADPTMRIRRLNCSPVKVSDMRSTIGVTKDKAEQVLSPGKPALSEGATAGDNTTPVRSDLYKKANEDLELREYLLETMTTAKHTQVRACDNLVVLTDRLHDWARNLDSQERWLHEERRQFAKEQQTAAKNGLRCRAWMCEAFDSDTEPSQKLQEVSELSDPKHIQQLRTVIEILQGNIEVLVTELRIEQKARKAVEEKLQAKGYPSTDWVMSDGSTTSTSTPSRSL